MQYFPLFLSLRDRRVLVVGGGGAAERKAAMLADAGALVTFLVSPHSPVANGHGRVIERTFVDADIAGAALVVVDCGDPALAARISAAAQVAGVPVNVVDQPELCTFVWPAIIDRDPITVAVTSAGASPVLARSVRARIEALLPANLGRLARFADNFRGAVKATRRTGGQRRRFWERFFSGPVAAAVLSGADSAARERMLALINRPDDVAGEVGSVALVGAGPGDPDLLTLKALRALQEADVIVHDRLIGPRILDYGRRDAERIDVGKAPGCQAMPQDAINALLASLAGSGRRVVRLKGGDPFIFARGGEERDHLTRLGISVEVIPGVTAAVAAAATTGIPLTHRDDAQAVTLMTAQGRHGEPDHDWQDLARNRHTLAVYMGAAKAGALARRLVAAGRDPQTPAAAIAEVSGEGQRVAVGALSELARLVRQVEPGPVMILIGEVVRHADAHTRSAMAQAAAR
ncbi:MAG: uroporphyrinogen-III C-methyltransferase [Rhodospirillales bacterium]|nr:uroporphyrinogen-III C-methyltransferase [Rhodospirillales bacterium]